MLARRVTQSGPDMRYINYGRGAHAQKIDVFGTIAKWDEDRSGSIHKSEFRRNVLDMMKPKEGDPPGLLGLEVEASEVDALFDSLDDDGSGSLELRESVKGLKELQQQAEQGKAEHRKLCLRLVDAVKIMKASQMEWKQRQEEEKRQKLAEYQGDAVVVA